VASYCSQLIPPPTRTLALRHARPKEREYRAIPRPLVQRELTQRFRKLGALGLAILAFAGQLRNLPQPAATSTQASHLAESLERLPRQLRVAPNLAAV